MPVTLTKKRGKWRTVEADTGRIARRKDTGTPLDGGGWPLRKKAVGIRQVGYINEAFGKKHNRI